MTTCAPSSNCQNPSEEGAEKGKTMLIGSCVLCWAVAGLVMVVVLVSMLVG